MTKPLRRLAVRPGHHLASPAHALCAGEVNVLAGRHSAARNSCMWGEGWGRCALGSGSRGNDAMALHLPPRSRLQLILIRCVSDWWGGVVTNNRLWSAFTIGLSARVRSHMSACLVQAMFIFIYLVSLFDCSARPMAALDIFRSSPVPTLIINFSLIIYIFFLKVYIPDSPWILTESLY